MHALVFSTVVQHLMAILKKERLQSLKGGMHNKAWSEARTANESVGAGHKPINRKAYI